MDLEIINMSEFSQKKRDRYRIPHIKRKGEKDNKRIKKRIRHQSRVQQVALYMAELCLNSSTLKDLLNLGVISGCRFRSEPPNLLLKKVKLKRDIRILKNKYLLLKIVGEVKRKS